MTPVTKRRKFEQTSSGGPNERRSSSIGKNGHDTHMSHGDQPSEYQSPFEEELPEDGAEATSEKGPQSDSELANGSQGSQSRRKILPRKEVRTGDADDDADGVYNGEIYKSNTFRIQVNDLLRHVKPKYGQKEAPAEHALRSLKAIIEHIPSRGPLPVADAEKELSKAFDVAIPFPSPRPPKHAKYQLAYERPANINVVGSYPLKIATRMGEDLRLDLAVTMPSTLFQEKDFLNYRYFYKRAYYLACIAAAIKGSKDHQFKVNYQFLNGNQLHPILLVSSGTGADDFSASKCIIQIMPVATPDVFPVDKTLPERNCVRSMNSEGAQEMHWSATPFYNASLRSDCSVGAYLKFLHATAAACESYRDACMLGRVWLRQRGLSSSIPGGGFGNFEWALLLAILLHGAGSGGLPQISTRYSSYQLFKVALQFLASKDLTRNPVVFQGTNTLAPNINEVPTLFDGLRGLNILFKMAPWSYKLLKHEARTTLLLLADSPFDQFDATFIIRGDHLLYRYDLVAQIPFASIPSDSSGNERDNINWQRCHKLYKLLTRGLMNRASLISVVSSEQPPWQIEKIPPSLERDATVLVGFLIDPLNWQRSVDHGPSAEKKKEAAEFRQFWGEKAELRRFKDGSILESLVWSTKESNNSIFEQTVLYLLQRHIGKGVADRARFFGTNFASVLEQEQVTNKPATSAFEHAMAAFMTLEKDIRALEGIPLHIRHVSAAAPQLSFTSLEAPSTSQAGPACEPADVVIQFEGSGRWPDDICAVQSTKIAFLLRIAELLRESVNGVTARVGCENEQHKLLNQSHLDVTYPSGITFRLRIHHDREPALLERLLKDSTLDAHNKEEAGDTLAAYKRDFLRSPLHTQSIRTLCTRFPALPITIRLLKKWFASHLLTPHISPALIELLAVRAFVHPYPWTAPSSASTGFLRSLFFLSQWDWHTEPLIVDLNASLQAADFDAIRDRFAAWRKLDPALNRVVLFTATSYDQDGTTWTDHAKPAKVVAARMTALARAACDVAQKKALRLSAGELFRPSLKDYDFLLHIDARFTRAGQRQKSQGGSATPYKNLALQSATAVRDPEMVGFDPFGMFLEELRDVYGHAILFFYDGCGGDVIGGLWNPGTEKKSWRIRLRYSTIPVAVDDEGSTATDTKERNAIDGEDDKTEVRINKNAILHEIARLGSDLIEKVEVIKQ